MPTESLFSNALAADMARLQLNDRQLGARMGITQQAVFKWKARGFPPAARVKDLIAALGRDSEVAKMTPAEMFGATPVPAETPGAAPLWKDPPFTESETRHDLQRAVLGGDHRTDITRIATERACAEFQAGLPPSLQGNLASGSDVLFYCSPRLHLEIVVRISTGKTPSAALPALRVLAAQTENGGTPVIAVITDTPAPELTLRGSLGVAQRAGCLVWVVDSGARLAQQVTQFEYGTTLAQEDPLEDE